MYRFVVHFVVLASLVVFGSCNESSVSTPSCPEGSETCACYGNGTCDAGLECRSDLCVELDDDDDDNNDDDDDTMPTDGDTVTDGDDDVTDGDSPTDGDTADDDDDNLDGDTPDDDDDDTTDGDDPTDGDGETGIEEDPRDGCQSDDDCDLGQYCYSHSDGTVPRCVDRKQECDSCSASRECLYTTDYCLPETYHGGGVCGSGCDDQECPTNYLCMVIPELNNAKQCVFDVTLALGTQSSPCCVHEDCNLPLSCRRGTAGKTCQNGCTANADCPLGMICDQPEPNRTGECVDGCTSIEECPGGTICVAGQCIEGECTESAHCALGYHCNVASRVCVSGCVEDDDCRRGTRCADGLCTDIPIGWECVSDIDCNSPENCLSQPYECDWGNDAQTIKICQLKTPCIPGKQVCCNESVGRCTPGCHELGDYLEDTGILTCNADGKSFTLSRCSSEYEVWPSNAPAATELYDCLNMMTSIACLYARRCTVETVIADPISDPAKNLSAECGWDNPYKICMEKTTEEWIGLVCSLRTVGEGVLCMDMDGLQAADCDVGLVCQNEADQQGNPTSPGYCVVQTK